MTRDEFKRAPIDARVLALNVTGWYQIAEEDQPYIQRIDDVFLYNRNEHVHCCELPPSYYLIYLYTIVVFYDGTVEDDVMAERLQDCYGNQETENRYVHCRQIDAIAANADSERYVVLGTPKMADPADYDTEEEWHEAEIAAVQEFCMANWPIC